MRAGELRQRITLQEKCAAQNAFGDETITWADAATVWAKVETVSADEFVAQQQFGAALTHKITIRWRANVIPTMQVVWGDRTLEVTGIVDDNVKRQLTLLCSEIAPGTSEFVVGRSAIGGSGAIVPQFEIGESRIEGSGVIS